MDVRAIDTPPLTKRLVRPGWRDPRLMVGGILLVGSVALGAWAVDAASATSPVYAARGVLTPGDPISAADLVVVEANTGAAQGTYLAPGDGADGVVLRAVGAGELVPAAAVAPEATLDRRPVVLDVGGGLPASVTPGAVVELWIAPKSSPGTGEEGQDPYRVATGLEVSRVDADASMLAGGTNSSVEVLVAVDDVPDVIAAKASGGEVVVVPVQSALSSRPAPSGDSGEGAESSGEAEGGADGTGIPGLPAEGAADETASDGGEG